MAIVFVFKKILDWRRRNLTYPYPSLLFIHHLFELVQTKNTVAVRVILREILLCVIFPVSTDASPNLLCILKYEAVLPAVLVVELANDLETPKMWAINMLTDSKLHSLVNCIAFPITLTYP